jgi:putative inorganic carbon (HCO3(-)) transporter
MHTDAPLRRWTVIAAVLVAAPLVGLLTAAQPMVGIAVAVTAGLVITVLRSHELLVLLAVGLVWSNALVVAATVHGVPRVVGLAVPALLCVPVVDHIARDREVVLPPALGWLLAYSLVVVLGLFVARDRELTVAGLVVFATEGLLLFLLVVNAVRTPRLLRAVLWTMLTVGAALSLLSILQTVTGAWTEDLFGFAQVSTTKLARLATDVFGERPAPRAGGPFAEQNRYAQILVVLIPIGAMFARWSGRRRDRVLAAGATGLVLVAVGLTYSRGALVALIVCLLAMVVLRDLQVRYFVLLAVVATVAVLSVPRWAERITSAVAIVDDGGLSETDGSVRGRLSSTLGSGLVFLEHPWLGVGLANYPVHHYDAALEIGIRVEDNRQPHSLYPQVAAESGIFGFIAFFGAIAVTARSSWRVGRRGDAGETGPLARAVTLALGTYLVSAVFLHLAYERYFWFLLALVAVAGRLDRAEGRFTEPVSIPLPSSDRRQLPELAARP